VTRVLLLVGALALAPAPAWAEPRSLPLDPTHAEVAFSAYALGAVPVEGTFSRFSGTLVIDPVVPGSCRVDIRIQVASLQMPDPSVREEVLSPELLDAAAFPILAYRGTCARGGIDGRLTLHGTTRPLHLAIVNDARHYTAEAELRRDDWGITGEPVMVGPTVRIRVSTTIPQPGTPRGR
jgi:polyisoprenoid-binding protein YceI